MEVAQQMRAMAVPLQGSAVAMGFFDGVHKGHQAVIQTAVEAARRQGLAPALFTFRLPPESRIKGPRLLPTEEKHRRVAPMQMFEGRPVSSTRIRYALLHGDVPAANAMLGAPYQIDFPVQRGKGLGHTLGFPTLNQVYPAGFQTPEEGVYITRTLVDGTWYPSATGFGRRPTVSEEGAAATCETFIPGFDGQLYGQRPVVEFYAFLEPSRKFAHLDDLTACVMNAAEKARQYFGAAPLR